MAEIKAFRAFRYHQQYQQQMEHLVSPLFDVVSEKQRKLLYENPINSVHISVPLGDNPHEHAREVLERWKMERVLVQDEMPCIYVYYQYFYLPNNPKQFCRKGFVCMVRAYDFSEKVMLRHENTIPYAVDDRIKLLEHTKMNASPTHGLYTDLTFTLERYMDEAMQHPLYQIEDYQGVTDAFAIIDRPEVVRQFVEVVRDKPIILADGHHRYESSVYFRKKMSAGNVRHSGNEGYNFHMMWLTNTEAHNLRILPTHRLINNLPPFHKEEVLRKAAHYFTIQPVDNPFELHEVILGKKWAFGLVYKDEAYTIRLKPERITELSWSFPNIVKEVDLTVLHYFFIEKVLGIKGKHQRNSHQIDFERNHASCIAEVMAGTAQIALITNEISIEEVKQVCYSGFTLPQKSTFFYPKVICGFVFGSVHENEFASKEL